MRARARRRPLLTVLLVSTLTGLVMAAPQVQNGSFEQDTYSVSPGYAGQNGGSIAGWTVGGSAGVNPVWRDPARKAPPESPFLDNGKVPDGRQAAFIQGPGSLRQRLPDVRGGCRYRVTYRENARVQRRGDEWPQVRVLLGGQVVVSAHEVTPVAPVEDSAAPFYRVESAWYTPAANGPLDLAIEAVQKSPTTTLLVDDVRLEEAPVP